MFCPKCGGQNPEAGKFCRKCGTDLGGVTDALSGKLPAPLTDRRGRPLTWDRALKKMALGAAFVVISFILGASGAGRGWWFWLLIPGFMMLAAGIAGIVQLQRVEKGGVVSAGDGRGQIRPAADTALPPAQTEWVTPESRYKTGDLVPPSVTDATTRHLELDSEGKTMTLPKK